MLINFEPKYTISSKIAHCLMRIEAVKVRVADLSLAPTVLASLQETARLYTTHYSTMIEGNVLSVRQIEEVLQHEGHFPGRERDEKEVKGYYAALVQVEKWAASGAPFVVRCESSGEPRTITEDMIKVLHALVMADGKVKVKPTPYRDGQNVIRDAATRTIVYMPPEAKDVPLLMAGMIEWINKTGEIPCPIVASIAHYQYATIHPYYDGNGRTARLLTTFLLHKGGYGLKGLYSLEEYYATNLRAYYEAISIGESHNYYRGRAEADITAWIEYCVEGMAIAFEKALQRMVEAESRGISDQSALMRTLDVRQRRALELFQEFEVVTAKQIGELFGFKSRSSAQLCAD